MGFFGERGNTIKQMYRIRRASRTASLICIITLMGLSSVGFAQQLTVGERQLQEVAVVGSYSSRLTAEDAAQDFAQAFPAYASQLQTIAATVNGRQWFRLVVTAFSEQSGRSLVSQLRGLGLTQAWHWQVMAHDVVGIKTDQPKLNATKEDSARKTVAVQASPSAPKLKRAVQPKKSKQKDAGDVAFIDELDGIPRHRIEINNYSDKAANITLDGKIEEPIWFEQTYYDEFMVAVPAKGTMGEFPTHMRVLATEKGLYVSAIMLQPLDTLVQRLSVRDDFLDRDTFGFIMDAGGEGLVGHWFITALGNSVQDGKLLPERNYQRDWDGPWVGRSHIREDGWSAEVFLPWSMVNMPAKDGKRTIGFAASRQVSHKDERYQWPGHPYSSAKFLSAFNEMKVEGVQPVSHLAVIPFAAATLDQANDDNDLRIGADIAWKPSPKLEVSATLNPDFGAVEADDVVLNLTAFETFFPEKRLFFLEGNEVFNAMPRATSGNIFRFTTNDDFAATSRRVFLRDYIPTPISLLNTRRIGGTARQVTVPDGVAFTQRKSFPA